MRFGSKRTPFNRKQVMPDLARQIEFATMILEWTPMLELSYRSVLDENNIEYTALALK